MTSANRLLAWLTPGKSFIVSLLLAALAVLASAAWSRHVEAQVMAHIAPHRLSDAVDVTTQLHPKDLTAVGARYAMVVDLRPDGEVAEQPTSKEMEAAAKRNGLEFAYIPVPHGEIPEESVAHLRAVLEARHGEILLYCRSGKRAARTWALAEASRSNGSSTGAIIAAVQAAGQEAEDLRSRIQIAVESRKR